MESPCMAMRGCSGRKRKPEPDLVDLPADLFGPVADKLPVIQDLVRFGAVCGWWRQLAVRKERRLNHDHGHGHPWLMLADDTTRKRSFYSPTRGEVLNIDVSGSFIGGSRCWGSPFGWLVVFPSDMRFMRLSNPLTRASVRVSSPLRMLRLQYLSEPIKDPGPRRGPNDDNSWCRLNVAKLLLTAPPDSPNCYLFAISFNSRRLGFLELGARPSRWSSIHGVDLWTDIVCFQGTTLFGCLKDGRVLTLDMSSQPPKALDFAPPPPPQDLAGSDGMNYLVDLRGELCMVLRCGGLRDRLRLEFRVLKMDPSTKQWTRIVSLGGHCLFLGTNYSYAVQASDQLKPDCIYYTNDDHDSYHRNYYYGRIKVCGTGIYDVLKGEATALTLPPSVAGGMTSPYCPPLWFTPRLS